MRRLAISVSNNPSTTGKPPLTLATHIAWVVAQLLALTLASLRIRLWTHELEASEIYALQILLITQIVVSSLLFDRIAADWRSVSVFIATLWPFTVLAGLLAGASVMTIAQSGGYATGWVAILWIWRLPLSSTKASLRATGVISTWVAAGPLLLFLGKEYSEGPLSPPKLISRIASGPLMNVLWSVDRIDDSRDPMLTMVVVTGLLGATVLITKVGVRRALLWTSKSMGIDGFHGGNLENHNATQ